MAYYMLVKSANLLHHPNFLEIIVISRQRTGEGIYLYFNEKLKKITLLVF